MTMEKIPDPDVSTLDALRSFYNFGLTLDESFAMAGVYEATAAQWLRDPRVHMVLRQARASAKLDLIQEIQNAADDDNDQNWRRKAYLLDRMSSQDAAAAAQAASQKVNGGTHEQAASG